MAAAAVVEGFHVLEDRPPGRLPGREAGAVDELGLERAEEALHGRVVVAVALAAHGLPEAVPPQHLAVGPARVLHAAVRVVDQPRRRLPAPDRHEQGVAGELAAEVVGHAPADDLAGRQVLDGGEVQPALAGRDVREILSANSGGHRGRRRGGGPWAGVPNRSAGSPPRPRASPAPPFPRAPWSRGCATSSAPSTRTKTSASSIRPGANPASRPGGWRWSRSSSSSSTSATAKPPTRCAPASTGNTRSGSS